MSELADRLIEFLSGTAPLDGVFFDDHHPIHKGKFWWRQYLPALRETIAALRSEPKGSELAITSIGEAADAFWRYWKANGETHKHGYYESTWGAINAALRVAGVQKHGYAAPSREQDQRSEAESIQPRGRVTFPAQSSDHPTPAQLSAEQIKGLLNSIEDEKACGEVIANIDVEVAIPLCRMALSSLTARDEGIEAAAKAIDADESGRDSNGYFAELVRALKGASHD